jgi:hypothetical protein
MRSLLTEKTIEIPKGHYCYTYFEGNIKICPFYEVIRDEGINIPYCTFIDEGGLDMNISTKNYEKLRKKYGSSKELNEKYPLDLLWDMVKECGENMDY